MVLFEQNDYFNMMMGPIKPQLLFAAIQTLSTQQNQRNPQVERQTPPSSSSNLVYLCAFFLIFNTLTFFI